MDNYMQKKKINPKWTTDINVKAINFKKKMRKFSSTGQRFPRI